MPRTVAVSRPGGSRTQPAWLLGMRDLQWRKRRFAVAILATGLVFGLALLMTGIQASFDNEIDRTVNSFHADAWVVPTGALGAFTAPISFPAERANEVAKLSGVKSAAALAVANATTRDPEVKSINLVGIEPGKVGSPGPKADRVLEQRGAAVVDDSLGLSVGDPISLDGKRFRVRATSHGLTHFAGVPTVTLTLAQVQKLRMNGSPLATGIVTKGIPTKPPPGMHILSNAQVREDLARPVAQAKQTITLIRSLLWLVAAGIIGAVLYLSALERVPDFAVLKAIGVTTRALMIALMIQALLLALVSVVVAIGFSILLSPAAAMSVEIPFSAYLTLAAVAIVVGVLASTLALRRAVAVDPAMAFGG
ncbi:MAG: putative transport system permease protein [Solirubrobacteraceae bacterium]|nr:putative transport system permease protein [Solirubrobacteraceae bacterium]